MDFEKFIKTATLIYSEQYSSPIENLSKSALLTSPLTESSGMYELLSFLLVLKMSLLTSKIK